MTTPFCRKIWSCTPLSEVPSDAPAYLFALGEREGHFYSKNIQVGEKLTKFQASAQKFMWIVYLHSW